MQTLKELFVRVEIYAPRACEDGNWVNTKYVPWGHCQKVPGAIFFLSRLLSNDPCIGGKLMNGKRCRTVFQLWQLAVSDQSNFQRVHNTSLTLFFMVHEQVKMTVKAQQ